MKKKLTKKQKQFIKDCCFDELDSAREIKTRLRKEGKPLREVNKWIRKQRELIKECEN